MNPARRDCEIDRAPADNIPFTRVGSPLIKIDIVSAAQIRREQSARQTAADENEFRHGPESTNQEARKTGKETEPRTMRISRMPEESNQLA
jgi:hypothetical protein